MKLKHQSIISMQDRFPIIFAGDLVDDWSTIFFDIFFLGGYQLFVLVFVRCCIVWIAEFLVCELFL